MQLLHNGFLVLVMAGEPLVKRLRVAKNVGQQEVEQGPQFVQVILQRRSRDEKPVSGIEEPDDLGERRLFIFDAMGLYKKRHDVSSLENCLGDSSSGK